MKPYLIASRYAPGYRGGLAAYQRCLAGMLGEDAGVYLAEETVFPGLEPDPAPLPWPLVRMEPTWLHRATASFWPRLASRPPSFPLFRRLTEHGWRWSVKDTPRVVHLVDAGWHFSGFAVARWARTIGARLTIWPAVHPGSWGDDRIDLELYRLADAVFCQSQAEADHLREHGLASTRIVRCGLPPMGPLSGDGLRFRERHGLGERPVAFFLGRRTEGKGYVALLKAWQKVLREVPDAVLVLAGAGGEEEPPGASLFPPDSWRYLGAVDDEEKGDAFAACTLFCLPSAHESFGIVFVEAWAYGKPVICGPAPASRELVADGVTGLWATQEPGELAAQLLRLLRHPDEARRMGEAGRAVQQERYTPAAMLDTHLRAWEAPPESRA